MTSITFYGGVKEIGGNKFLVEDRGTKVFMDFGMSFSEEGKYFSEFVKPRGSNILIDLMELGMLPRIEGIYRQDYAAYMGLEENAERAVDAVLLTHAHLDHCGYLKYLRPDITVYCSEESRLIMENFDATGQGDQYLTLTEKFRIGVGKSGAAKGLPVKIDGKSAAKIPRDVRTFESYKKFNIDSIEVEPLPVDHSISGVNGFILNTSSGTIANTADLRFHGRRPKETERFVERCSESSLDTLLCEGTRISKEPSITEFDIEDVIEKMAEETKNLVVCGYPVRDLDRLQSFYLAAQKSGRYLVIEPKQAYLLKLFSDSFGSSDPYPDPKDKNIKIYMPKTDWGFIDKDRGVYPDRLVEQDYKKWAREFLSYPNMVDHRDVAKKQSEMMFTLSDYKLQELIDIQPKENSSYIRSTTEPFSEEMEIKEERFKNWFVRFGLVKSEKDWHSVHVSGHGDGEQIKRVIDGAGAKKLIPIHTDPDNEAYHQKWHSNVQPVQRGETVVL